MIGWPAPTSGALRVLRGGLLAWCSAALAVGAHVAGGGSAPDASWVLLVTVLLAGAGAALARRQRGVLGILGVLAGNQVALHYLLSCCSGHPVIAMTWTMTAAHAVAVLGTALLLARAEAAVFAVAGALSRLLPRPLTFTPINLAPRVLAGVEVIDRALCLLHSRVYPRRGPPRMLLTSAFFPH